MVQATTAVNVKTIELSLDAAKALLPVVDRELETARHEYDAALEKVEQLQTLRAELQAKISNFALPLQDGQSLRRRKPKGFASNAIETLLKDFPSGLSLQQIQSTTGIDHSTVYRTLKDAKRNRGKFIEENGLWKNAA